MSQPQPTQPNALSDAQCKRLASFIHKHTGIHLTPQKYVLLNGRMSKLLRQRGITFEQYERQVMTNPLPKDLTELANHISTNHTYFSREVEHFTFLSREVFPWIRARSERTGKKELRMWCAAASTGQEPYTLAMLQMEYFGGEFSQWDAGLLATDISKQALEQAKQGKYPAGQVESLSPVWQRSYFMRLPNGDYQVRPEVKKQVLYRPLNLITPRFPFKRPFDVIFCRNVLIYFDIPTKEALTERFQSSLVPGGYLFLGMAEALADPKGLFRPVRPAVYQRI
jgi:chemotaxis protein methyltransferase CheR